MAHVGDANAAATAEQPPRRNSGMWAAIKEGYEGLVMTVIRPMRAIYAVDDLGPAHALIRDVVTHRIDLELKNDGGYTLQCSWWKPRTTAKDAKLPCIVLLHGNSSCRLGGLEIVTHAIPAGFSVFALDFAGSGLSDGQFVSLGSHEQRDIATVVAYLQQTNETSRICLWGRSMGAVAALLYAQTHPDSIHAMVLDSPFSSLPKLATELVDDGKLGVPKLAVTLVMRLIRRDIKNRAKFDMFKLKPIAKIHKCTIPAFFVVGLQDELVGPHHVQDLYKRHNGPNQLFEFSGGHNSPRPTTFFVQATQFLRVMIGLLPLPLETMPSSPEPAVKAPRRRVFSNPLARGESVANVPRMSIKQLKAALDRVGYGDIACVEKHELVALVLQLHACYKRSSREQLSSSSDVEDAGVEDDIDALTRELRRRTSDDSRSATNTTGNGVDSDTQSTGSSNDKSPLATSQKHEEGDSSSSSRSRSAPPLGVAT